MSSTRQALMAFGDLSIHDYADNPKIPRGTRRIKKSVTTKHIMKCAPDLVAEQEDVEMQEAEEGEESEEVMTRLGHRAQALRSDVVKSGTRLKDQHAETSASACRDYPFDLWMQLGMHIDLEDIGRFALICKKTCEVTKTSLFWKTIHKKYLDKKKYKSDISYFKKSSFFLRINIVKDICKYIDRYRFRKLALCYLIGRQCYMATGSGKNCKILIKFTKVEPLPRITPILVERLECFGAYMLVEPVMHYFVFLEIECLFVPPLDNLLGKRLINFTEANGNLHLHFSGNVSRQGQYQGEMVDLVLHKATYQVLNWWDYAFPASHHYNVCPHKQEIYQQEFVPDSWENSTDD